MLIDLASKTMHCGKHPNSLVLSLASLPRGFNASLRQEDGQATKFKVIRNNRLHEEIPDIRESRIQLLAGGKYVAQTMAILGRGRSKPSNQTYVIVVHAYDDGGVKVEIFGPADSAEETKFWATVTVQNVPDLWNRSSTLSPFVRDRGRRPTAWDRLRDEDES